MLSFHKNFHIMASPQIQVAFDKPTPVSKFLKMLIKFCIIPLKITRSEEKTTVMFKYRSKQTLIFLFYQLILTGLVWGFMGIYMTGINQIMKWFMAHFQHSNIIDFVSLLVLQITNMIPFFALAFVKHLTCVANGLILSPSLQLPNHWKKFVLSSFVSAISSAILMHTTLMSLKIDDEDIDLSWWLVGSYIQIIYICLLLFIIFFVVLCLIDEFKRIVCLRKINTIQHTDNCIDGFKTLQNGFGKFFLIIFSYHQIENVFFTYMGISSLMSIKGNLLQNVVLSVSYFTMTAYSMIILYCITLTAEEAYDALQSLNTPLEKMLINEKDLKRKELIRATMKKLEKIRPLNGNGYFDITRETLTSIVSTTVTYLIILLQFR